MMRIRIAKSSVSFEGQLRQTRHGDAILGLAPVIFWSCLLAADLLNIPVFVSLLNVTARLLITFWHWVQSFYHFIRFPVVLLHSCILNTSLFGTILFSNRFSLVWHNNKSLPWHPYGFCRNTDIDNHKSNSKFLGKLNVCIDIQR